MSETLSSEPLLVSLLGEDDVYQAWSVLVDLARRHAAWPDGDVTAFFETCGWNTVGTTLNARLFAYAESHHVDERTARRRSDRGILKVATLLRHGVVYDRPLARLIVYQTGTIVTSWLELLTEAGSPFISPTISINGQTVEGLKLERETLDIVERYDRVFERLPDAELDRSAEEFDPLVAINVAWAADIWPSWDLTAHIADDRLFARLQVDRHGAAEVGVCWINKFARSAGKQPFRAAPYIPPPPGSPQP